MPHNIYILTEYSASRTFIIPPPFKSPMRRSECGVFAVLALITMPSSLSARPANPETTIPSPDTRAKTPRRSASGNRNSCPARPGSQDART